MEEDIQNHSPTVMFRGTPCSIHEKKFTYSILEKQLYSSSIGNMVTSSMISIQQIHWLETADIIYEKQLTISMRNCWHHPWYTAGIIHEKQLTSPMKNSCHHSWETAVIIHEKQPWHHPWYTYSRHHPWEIADIFQEKLLTSSMIYS